jgi:hypothetical protein
MYDVCDRGSISKENDKLFKIPTGSSLDAERGYQSSIA